MNAVPSTLIRAVTPSQKGTQNGSPRSPLGPRWRNWLRVLLGTPSQRRLGRAALQIDAIRWWEKSQGHLGDDGLRAAAIALRSRARGGESLAQLLPEAYGLVCQAAYRTLGFRPFDVQLAAAAVMHRGTLVELATGEGKTLVAAFPTFLNALPGHGAHVMTVNDYLAKRDAALIGPIHQALGLTVGTLESQMNDVDKVNAYRCDVTYGTSAEFGFDFLRDRIRQRASQGRDAPFWSGWLNGPQGQGGQATSPPFQRGHHFALVDEADSVFIDEARTPLIIGNPPRLASPEEQVVFLWANEVAPTLVNFDDFYFDRKKISMALTEPGRKKVRWSKPPRGPHAYAMDKLFEHVERALNVHHRYRRDQHYMVQDNRVVLIDEYSGRGQPDRHWQDGMHQAAEAKEGVPITTGPAQAAQITYQRFFQLYRTLTGMTGTAVQNFWELRRVYKLWVVCVPTNCPVQREQWPDQIFPTEEEKFAAVVDEVAALHSEGRPVLIGTRSVEISERLSARLQSARIPHQVLNARQTESEAQIIARAGQRSQVTIATNMAGRGTDIKLGPGVLELGGLHVLATERHEARRIDRQLAGRAGRQGEPGSCQFFLSLEDQLLEGLGPAWQVHLRDLGRQKENIRWERYQPWFNRAQRRVEKQHRRQRLDLMFYEKHRRDILSDLAADPHVD